MPHLPSVLWLIAALAASAGAVQAQLGQIEQARRFQGQSSAEDLGIRSTVPPPALEGGSSGDGESFGVQQFLGEKERLRPFRAFADVSGYGTSNVALSSTDQRRDVFLIASFGLEYRGSLPRGFQWEASLKVAGFRYNEFRELDFNSVDAGTGLSYHAEQLGGIDLFLRYNFNALLNDSEDVFFKNHTITLGAQKAVVFSQAHYAFAGIAGLLGYSDPKAAQRSELSAFAGYHLQPVRRFDVDLVYRYGYFLYTEERRDHNHTLSLAFRYQFTDWLSAAVNTFATANRSNRRGFDYDVGNVGGGLTVSLQF